MHAPSSAGDGRHLRSIPPARLALIDRIARIRLPRGPQAAATRMSAQFLRTYYRGVGEEDLAARTPAALAHAARCHLELGRRRFAGESLVRVFNPDRERDGFESPHTVVQIVTDDRPFLIDSLGLAFSRAGLAVHVIVHPVLEVRRDGRGRISGFGADGARAHRAESWEMYEVDRRTDAETLERLRQDIERTLAEVRAAVEDWDSMRERVRAIVAELESNPPPLSSEEIGEARQLLQWMEERNFVFLGYRQYRLERGARQDSLRSEPRSGLGILRARSRGERPSVTALKGELRERARERELLVLTKANSISTIHRSEYLDYVGVKTFDARGEVSGEHRFLGLWTSTAYHRSPRDIPVLRLKVARVIQYFGLDLQSHDGKAVLNVLETYPRDELFQANTRDLVRICRGVVNLYERRTVRLLTRRDPYHRFFSCLVYVPRDRYNTDVRQRIERIVLEGFGGKSVESQVQISTASHARVQVVVRTEPGEQHKIDLAAIERQISDATLSWSDHLHEVLIERRGEAEGLALANRYRHVFPMAYEEDVPPAEALADIANLEQLRASPLERRVSLHRTAGQAATGVHLKIVKLGETVSISDLLPMLENFGLRVIAERPYEIAWPEGGVAWIQDFELEHRDGCAIDLPRVAERFKEALAAGWDGAAENDGFNRLLFSASLSAREILVLRAYCRYLLQTGVPFSQAYMERTLAANPAIAAALVRLFEARFDPQRPHGTRAADRAPEQIVARIRTGLDRVSSLDEDRILRAYLTLVQATMRTNYYRRGTAGAPLDYLSFKFSPAAIPDLPLPRPKYEIFVYSPRVEGVHLRMGDVARGGIRWSDRREDFRTEILGLAKAQEVKNSVIVPSGAKGGFVCKQLPDPSEREAYSAEVLACYRMFISAMLDVTDNLRAGQAFPPDRVIRHDGDDPYLVVAADKGTATFSDTANEIALSRGFWLGDAFASGGSAGYDHKKMGITARGTWESVRFHFQALGIYIDQTDFTVAGIGDMSGDVFGNGMLLSKRIKLVAAFDHRHVFLDPDPDPAVSYAERQRMFDLPRSSWADYDRSLISAGGGIWPRSAKSVPISPQARSALGLDASVTALSPDELISAILMAPVDLLWNGGVGTYVKATSQAHADAGDRSNDAVRVDASQLRAKVIGEGGNLGLTQEARIEFALNGGLVNTDFIDNSAGVDTSDHEVNIKILLDEVVRSGELRTAERDDLLQAMTDEVGRLVLAHNYHQNRSLAAARAQAAQLLHVHARYIRKLEREGRIRRRLDVLPGDKDIAERRSAGTGLTLPEYSVLLAHTKIAAAQEVLASEVPDDPYLRRVLVGYFPAALRGRYADQMLVHRLHREIITTSVVNDMVDRSGISYAFRLNEETGASIPHITEAWLVAREVFDMPGFWRQLESLDGKVDSSDQILALLEGRKLTERATRWLLRFRRPPFDIAATIDFFLAGVLTVATGLPKLLVGTDLASFGDRREIFAGRGFPADLSDRIAAMVPAYSAFDIVEIAAKTRRPVEETAEVYFDLADRLQITRLRDRITALRRDDRWNTMARNSLREDLYTAHAELARDVLRVTEAGPPEERLAAWVARNESAVARAAQTLVEIWESDSFNVATLSVAVRAVRTLVATSTLPG